MPPAPRHRPCRGNTPGPGKFRPACAAIQSLDLIPEAQRKSILRYYQFGRPVDESSNAVQLRPVLEGRHPNGFGCVASLPARTWRRVGIARAFREACAPAAGREVPGLPQRSVEERQRRLLGRAGLLEGPRRGRADLDAGSGVQPPARDRRLPGSRQDAARRQASRRRVGDLARLGPAGRSMARGRTARGHDPGGPARHIHRRAEELLGVPAGGSSRSADSGQSRLEREPDRPLRAGQDARARPATQRAGGQADLAAPGDIRPDRTAAHSGRGGGVPQRCFPGSLRARGREPARIAVVRRALGPSLAGRCPLCGLDRQRRGSPLSVRLEVPRLRDRGIQQRHALRPIRAGTDRRRSAARQRSRQGQPTRHHRHRLPCARPEGHRAAGQAAHALRRLRRADRGRLQEHAGPDGRLRSLPRPQVRPDPDQGLLLAGRHLRLDPQFQGPFPARLGTAVQAVGGAGCLQPLRG